MTSHQKALVHIDCHAERRRNGFPAHIHNTARRHYHRVLRHKNALVPCPAIKTQAFAPRDLLSSYIVYEKFRDVGAQNFRYIDLPNVHSSASPFDGQHHGTFQRHENAATNRTSVVSLVIEFFTGLWNGLSRGCERRPALLHLAASLTAFPPKAASTCVHRHYTTLPVDAFSCRRLAA